MPDLLDHVVAHHLGIDLSQYADDEERGASSSGGDALDQVVAQHVPQSETPTPFTGAAPPQGFNLGATPPMGTVGTTPGDAAIATGQYGGQPLDNSDPYAVQRAADAPLSSSARRAAEAVYNDLDNVAGNLPTDQRAALFNRLLQIKGIDPAVLFEGHQNISPQAAAAQYMAMLDQSQGRGVPAISPGPQNPADVESLAPDPQQMAEAAGWNQPGLRERMTPAQYAQYTTGQIEQYRNAPGAGAVGVVNSADDTVQSMLLGLDRVLSNVRQSSGQRILQAIADDGSNPAMAAAARQRIERSRLEQEKNYEAEQQWEQGHPAADPLDAAIRTVGGAATRFGAVAAAPELGPMMFGQEGADAAYAQSMAKLKPRVDAGEMTAAQARELSRNRADAAGYVGATTSFIPGIGGKAGPLAQQILTKFLSGATQATLEEAARQGLLAEGVNDIDPAAFVKAATIGGAANALVHGVERGAEGLAGRGETTAQTPYEAPQTAPQAPPDATGATGPTQPGPLPVPQEAAPESQPAANAPIVAPAQPTDVRAQTQEMTPNAPQPEQSPVVVRAQQKGPSNASPPPRNLQPNAGNGQPPEGGNGPAPAPANPQQPPAGPVAAGDSDAGAPAAAQGEGQAPQAATADVKGQSLLNPVPGDAYAVGQRPTEEVGPHGGGAESPGRTVEGGGVGQGQRRSEVAAAIERQPVREAGGDRGEETQVTPSREPMIGPSTPSIESPEFTKKIGTATGIKNATASVERAVRGIPEAEQAAERSFGDVWNQAANKLQSDPVAADNLVKELADKPRAVTDVEDATLLHHQIRLQSEYAQATEALNQMHAKAGEGAGGKAMSPEQFAKLNTDPDYVAARIRWDTLNDQLYELYNVNKSVGTETGRGLNARKMMANADYSLASMEARKRAAKGGEKLTPEEAAKIADLQKKIAASQAAMDDHEAKVAAVRSTPTTGEQAKERNLERSIAALEKKINEGDLSPMNRGPAPTADSKRVAELKARRDDLSQQLADMRKAPAKTPLEIKKGSMSRNIVDLAERIKRGDYSRGKPAEPVRLDEEGLRLKAENERLKDIFQQDLRRDQLKRRTFSERTQDTFVKWRRAFLLSSPVTVAKLTSAAGERMAFTPIEEATGGAIGKAFPKLAAAAPREGAGLSAGIEARAMAKGFTKGMVDSWRVLKTGKSDLDTAFGKASDVPPSWIDFLGNLHGALKAPAKRNEFERSFAKRMEWHMRQGNDVTDPVVQMRAATDAYKDANRSIFMQDNRVVNAYKRAVGALEQRQANGQTSAAGKLGASAAKMAIPIVRVPTNIVAETMNYALGSVAGTARLAKAYAKGIENLSPEDADSIMRSLKKGSLGAAVMALGYFKAGDVGGYYQPGQKRDEKDVKVGGVRVFGVDVPRYLVHNPLLESLQIGATIRRVADSRLRKKDEDTQGVGSGSVAAALGLLEETPFVREAVEVGKIADPRDRTRAAGEAAKSLLVPQAVQFAAQHTGDQTPRKPDTVWQHVEMGIPGLRQRVPEDTKKEDDAMRADLVAQVRADHDKGVKAVLAAYRAGKLKPNEVPDTIERGSMSDLKYQVLHESVEAAMRAWDRATAQQRDEVRAELLKKLWYSTSQRQEQKFALARKINGATTQPVAHLGS